MSPGIKVLLRIMQIHNSFLSTYLRIFYHNFPLKKLCHNQYNKAWITTGVTVTSQHKRDLYLLCRSTKDPKLKFIIKHIVEFYLILYRLLKKLYYNKLIINSNNKAKSIWNIVKKKKSKDDGPPLNTDGKTFKGYQSTANIFNTYFTNATDKMSVNNSVTKNLALNNFTKCLLDRFHI